MQHFLIFIFHYTKYFIKSQYGGEIMSELGRRLKYERIRRGMTCEGVANKLGLNKGEISRYESGVRIPNATVLGAFAVLYKVSADFLLGLKS
jgi:transcriptional regulator with XRE-family HTH domain